MAASLAIALVADGARAVPMLGPTGNYDELLATPADCPTCSPPRRPAASAARRVTS